VKGQRWQRPRGWCNSWKALRSPSRTCTELRASPAETPAHVCMGVSTQARRSLPQSSRASECCAALVKGIAAATIESIRRLWAGVTNAPSTPCWIRLAAYLPEKEGSLAPTLARGTRSLDLI